MRILFLHHGHERGGAPISLLLLMRELSELGHSMDLVNTCGRAGVSQLYQSICGRVYNARMWFYPHSSLGWMRLDELHGLWRNLRWILLYPWGCLSLLYVLIFGPKYDAIHFNSATLILYGWIPCLLRKPLVCHIREPFASGHLGVRRWFLRQCLKWFTVRCVGICEDNALDTQLPEGRCTLVYNPVDFAKFDPERLKRVECRAQLGVPAGSFVTLFAGGANATVKGLPVYVAAMLKLSDRITNLVCLMPSFEEARLVGDMGRSQYYELKKRALIIEAPFVFDIEMWIAASDAVYALHLTPHFSRTVMEAGAMRRAVITSDIDGIREVVTDHVTGILCPVGDVDSVLNASLELLDCEEMGVRFWTAGFEQACRLFDSKAHGRQILQIYQESVPDYSIT